MTDKIKKLTDREQAREKLSIWYGSRDNYYHGIKELIANAADELRNHSTDPGKIEISLSNGNKQITVSDNGRGIRIGGETDGEKNYDLLFRTLFAGTKYDVTESVTTGTNGVGTTVLNFTSKLFAVMSHYDGKVHKVRFKDGGELDGEYFEKDLGDLKDIHGSTFVVELDETIYPKVEFSPEKVKEIVQHFAVSTPGVEYTFSCNDKKFTFEYENIQDRFDELVGSSPTSDIFTLGEIENLTEVEIVDGDSKVIEKNSYNVVFTTSPDVYQESYLNMTWLENGGSINDGILDGVRLFMNKYCRENKLFPAKITSFSKEDIETSISFVGMVESNIVEFSNQTKLSTNKLKYKNEVKEYVNSALELAQKTNPKSLKKMADHLLEVQKANGINDRAKKKLKKKLVEKVEGISNRVDKLIDCEVHGKEAELFITEGDSANGSIVDSRDDEFQAAFPLRGKVLNVLKAPVDRIFANQEILNMVKIIGTGIKLGSKDDFNIDNARFGKIIITADADEDGFHIASLIIGFIYRFMKPLIENGYVYIAQTPLYELKFKDDSVVYFRSENEKNEKIGEYKDQSYTISRLKGLGEVDAETMHFTTMNPETRTILQITVEEAKEMEKSIEGWLSDNVEYRKEVITDRLPEFVHDID